MNNSFPEQNPPIVHSMIASTNTIWGKFLRLIFQRKKRGWLAGGKYGISETAGKKQIISVSANASSSKGFVIVAELYAAIWWSRDRESAEI